MKLNNAYKKVTKFDNRKLIGAALLLALSTPIFSGMQEEYIYPTQVVWDNNTGVVFVEMPWKDIYRGGTCYGDNANIGRFGVRVGTPDADRFYAGALTVISSGGTLKMKILYPNDDCRIFYGTTPIFSATKWVVTK